jgi:hypothetical protein
MGFKGFEIAWHLTRESQKMTMRRPAMQILIAVAAGQRTRAFVGAAIVALTVLLFYPCAHAATTGTVNGTVVDSDGKVVPNQKVRIKKVVSRAPIGKLALVNMAADALTVATVTTDKDGKFSQSLDPGEYWAEAGSKTLGYAKERITIKAGEATDVKLSLTKDDAPK